MEKEFESLYHDLESWHWWFKSRREKVVSMIPSKTKGKILDVGCASGYLLRDLENKGFGKKQIVGVDISEKAVAKAKELGYNAHIMNGADISFEKESFEVLIASDCLEHIENDKKALENWLSLLKPGGMAVIFVPAFMFLWSGHDVINHHFRRYALRELKYKAKQAGFTVKKSGFWNFALFFPIALVRTLKKSQNDKGDLGEPGKVINGILLLLLRIENALMKVLRWPVGVSTFVVLEKK